MTYHYCTFKQDAEHVCRYPEGFTIGSHQVAEHIPVSDPDYQEWLKLNPSGPPMADAPGQPWAVTKPAPLTPAEKLAASGLTVEELKGLLGL